MSKMILCTDSNNGIGKGNTIPWHSSEDFKHFKECTTNSIIVMGYNTWKSLPSKPLSNRLNVVAIDRDYPYELRDECDKKNNVVFIPTVSLGLFLYDNPDSIVIGGAKIYDKCINFVDEIIKTTITGIYECDTFFDITSYGLNLECYKVQELAEGVNVQYFKVNKG